MDTRTLTTAALVSLAALALTACGGQQPAPAAAPPATTAAATPTPAFTSPQDMAYRVSTVVDVSDCTDPVHDAEQSVSVECSIIGVGEVGERIRVSVVAPARIPAAVDQLAALGWMSKTGPGWIVSVTGDEQALDEAADALRA